MLARSTQALRAFTRRDATRLGASVVLIVVVLGSILAVDALPGPLAGPRLIVGDVATVDIRAPRAGSFVSDAATQQRRDDARAQVPPQYDYTAERGRASADRQLRLFEEAVAPIDAAFAAVLTPDARALALRNAMPHLSATARQALAELDQPTWTALRAEMVRILEQTQRQEIRDAQLADRRAAVLDEVGSRFEQEQRVLAAEIVAPLIVANSTFDAAATEAAREEAASRVQPVQFNILRGEIIVQRGQRIDEVTREKLAFFGLLDPQPDLARVAGWFLLAGLLVALLLSWLWRFRPEFWHRDSALVLIALVLLVAAAALKATGDRSLLPYFVPTAAVGLLLAVLLDTTVATVVLALLAVVAGVVVGTVDFAAYVLLGGLAGVILVRRGERIGHFLQAAAGMAVVNVVVVGLFALLGERDFTGLLQLITAGIVAAGGSAVVAVGSFAVLGNIFGITTSFQLLELANPSQPLLRRLLLETPGTYHHSLMVGNLAERAAEAIAADPLLTRVAAYYHDIGKLANPLAFIENQGGVGNVHDELTPEQSVALLKSHVANGIDLAYEFKLPKAIIAFIPQHHGTALM
nr:HDIG domain-containing protein [Chloroflexota bacterium]